MEQIKIMSQVLKRMVFIPAKGFTIGVGKVYIFSFKE